MSNEGSSAFFWKLKLIIWSISAGVIVAFFFGTNFLSDFTGFNPGGSVLFISPLVCSFILGVLTWEYEIHHTIMASILMTVTAIVLIIFMMMSPDILGVVDFRDEEYYPIIKNLLVSVVLIFPVALLGSITGKFVTGSAFLSPQLKRDRALLRMETDEWYQMLEEYVESRKKNLLKEEDTVDDNVAEEEA